MLSHSNYIVIGTRVIIVMMMFVCALIESDLNS